MECSPTVQKVAQTIYRDPMSDRIEPGKCRLCGQRLAVEFNEADTGFGVLQIPNAVCEPAKKLYERGTQLAEVMKEEAKKWRRHKIEQGQEQREMERDQMEDAARAALGIHKELTPVKPVVSTGEF